MMHGETAMHALTGLVASRKSVVLASCEVAEAAATLVLMDVLSSSLVRWKMDTVY
jgi:hypothetical protein